VFLFLALAAPQRGANFDKRLPKNATKFGDHPPISSVEDVQSFFFYL
jgi:hypothetical protein